MLQTDRRRPSRSSSGSPRWISVRPSWCAVSGSRMRTSHGRRLQEVKSYSTMTTSLLGMADHLRGLGVTRVVMEATSDYWKPPVLPVGGARVRSVAGNAKDVKHLPGRPKTDRLDAVWLCKVAERQMIRPSFVPPPEIRRLRDLTRYRVDLIRVRTAEKQRVEKLLEDAQIKLSVVASDIFGVSGRAMMAALIGGQTQPEGVRAAGPGADAGQDSRPWRRRSPATSPTTTPSCCRKMLARIDQLAADIAELDTRDRGDGRPFRPGGGQRLDEIPGVGATAAAVILAEIGLDMTRFPTAAHLPRGPGSPPA